MSTQGFQSLSKGGDGDLFNKKLRNIQSIAVGTRTCEKSAALELKSATKGVLIPRQTTAQRNAIPSPVEGLMIYNTTTHTVDTYNKADMVWRSVVYANDTINLGDFSFDGATVSTTGEDGMVLATDPGTVVKINSDLTLVTGVLASPGEVGLQIRSGGDVDVTTQKTGGGVVNMWCPLNLKTNNLGGVNALTATSVTAQDIVATTLTGTLSAGDQPRVTALGVQSQNLHMGGHAVTEVSALTSSGSGLEIRVRGDVDVVPSGGQASFNVWSPIDAKTNNITNVGTVKAETFEGLLSTAVQGSVTAMPGLVSINSKAVPGSDFVGVSDAQTLTNKTIDGSQIVNQSLTLGKLAPVLELSVLGNPTSASSAPGAVSMDTLKTMGNLVDTATLGSWTGSSNVSSLSSTVNGLTFPSSNFVGVSDAQTLTNKTIDGSQIINQSLALEKLAPVSAFSMVGNPTSTSSAPGAVSMDTLKTMGNLVDTATLGSWTGSSTVSTLSSTVNGLTFPSSNFVGVSDAQTITNKTIDGSQIVNQSLALEKLAPVSAFSMVGNPTSASSIPDAVSMATLKTMGNLVDTALLGSWTGSSNVSTLSSTVNGRTLPSSNFVGVSDAQTITNKTIDGSQIVSQSIPYNKLATSTGPYVLGITSGTATPAALTMAKLKTMGSFLDSTWTGSSNVNTLASTVNGLTFPSSNFVGISDAQTLTNKTINGSQIVNQSLALGKLAPVSALSLIGNSSSSSAVPDAVSMTTLKTMGNLLDTTWTGSSNVSTLASTVNGLTFPTSNFVGLNDAQTLTNKTINGSQIVNQSLTLDKVAPVSAFSLIGNSSSSSAVPGALSTVETKSLLGLNNVQNTALSTWTGSTNITTVGSLTTLNTGSITSPGNLTITPNFGAGNVQIWSPLDMKTNSISNVGSLNTLTLPSSNFVGINDAQTLTNKTLNGSQIVNQSLALGKLAPVSALSLIGNSGSSSAVADAISMATLKTMGNFLDTTWTGSSNVTTLGSTVNGLTFPSSNFVGISDAQTLTNKTINGSQIVNQSLDLGKVVPVAALSLIGNSTSSSAVPDAVSMATLKTMGNFLDTTWTGSSNVTTLGSTVNGLTFPSSNFVGISDAQTLTNKTINGSQIVNQSLDLGKIVPVAAFSLIGNSSSSSAVPGALTTAQVKTMLNISDQQSITLNGDVTGSGTGSVTTSIASGSVSLGKMAILPANSIIGNNTGVTATPIALTTVQTKTLLALNNVENTALSTWTGSTNITTIGSLSTLNTGSITSSGSISMTPNGGASSVNIWGPLDMKSNSISNVGALNSLTLPSSNFVGISDAQTLTNKTIDGSQIVSSSITTAKLADECVTAAKIATGVIPTFPTSYLFRRKDATQNMSALSGINTVVSFPTAVASNNITYTSTGSDFYATVAEAGRYIVQWALTWNYAASQTRIDTYVQYSSATAFTRHGYMSYGSGSSSDFAISSSAVLNLVANDAVRVWFMHNHTGNLVNIPTNINEWGYLNIVRIQ